MFARTKRLTLRPGWPEDAATLAAAIAHPEVASRLARVPWPYHLADAETFLSLPRGPHDAQFLVFDHEQDAPRLVGGIGLVGDGAARELGYWLTPAVWGRGYATEAAEAVVDMARHALPVRRLTAFHHAANAASGRVLTKLGFREVARTLRHSLAQGGEVDSVMMTLDLDAPVADAAMPIAA
jgi:RimJ/RimL family protein N-acetyltransferase